MPKGLVPSKPGETPWKTVIELLRLQIDFYEALLPKMPQPHAHSPERTRRRLEQDYLDKGTILNHYQMVLGTMVSKIPLLDPRDECNCGMDGPLGEHHATTCPNYTPF